MADAKGEALPREGRLAYDAARALASCRAARDAAVQAGALDVALRWLREHGDDRDIVRGAGEIISAIHPDEAFLRQNVLPLTAKNNTTEVRYEAILALGAKGNNWAVEPLLDLLKGSLADSKDRRLIITAIAQALAEIGDARAIPLRSRCT